MNNKLLIKLAELNEQISKIEQKISINQEDKDEIFYINILPDILEFIRKKHSLSAKEIIGRGRQLKTKTIRNFLILAILKNEKHKITLKQIGNLFNFRNHATIINSKKSALNFIETDEDDLFEYNLIFNYLDKLYNDYNF